MMSIEQRNHPAISPRILGLIFSTLLIGACSSQVRAEDQSLHIYGVEDMKRVKDALFLTETCDEKDTIVLNLSNIAEDYPGGVKNPDDSGSSWGRYYYETDQMWGIHPGRKINPDVKFDRKLRFFVSGECYSSTDENLTKATKSFRGETFSTEGVNWLFLRTQKGSCIVDISFQSMIDNGPKYIFKQMTTIIL